MTSTELAAVPNGLIRTDTLSQATAIEQARAIAEVQGAILVAQQCRRDEDRAYAQMRRAAAHMSPERAFYAVPNRGAGKSVHLARELIRIWGNCDWGVRELSNNDTGSEMLAYAWDLETNSRSTRSFISPHIKMAGGKRKPLFDINDIYLNNQNIGARAVRECILNVLPEQFTDEAAEICRGQLERTEDAGGRDATIDKMLAAFSSIGVTLDRIERKVGRKRAEWTPADIADMRIVFQSIKNDGLDKDTEFPSSQVTLDEIAQRAAQAAPAAPAGADGLVEPTADDIADLNREANEARP